MSWFALFIAGLLEVVWAFSMKLIVSGIVLMKLSSTA